MKGATGRNDVNYHSSSISIHAPVKGATRASSNEDAEDNGISIHAPVKGATVRVQTARLDLRISIHAPVKGATLPQCHSRQAVKEFQSTLP